MRRAIRSHGFSNPLATLPQPSHKTIPYPKALATSKGWLSFMTCQQARASLCATALMATTARLLAHFFWYQRLIAASHTRRGQVLNSYLFERKVESKSNLSQSFSSVFKSRIRLQPT